MKDLGFEKMNKIALKMKNLQMEAKLVLKKMDQRTWILKFKSKRYKICTIRNVSCYWWNVCLNNDENDVPFLVF